MIRRLGSIVLFVSVIAACSSGGEWTGTWTGSVSFSGSCSDGSSVPPTPTAFTLGIVQSGNSITWQSACGATANGSINGNTATVDQYSCPATISDAGVTTAVTVTGGTLTLNGNTLNVSLTATETIGTATCNVIFDGPLARE